MRSALKTSQTLPQARCSDAIEDEQARVVGWATAPRGIAGPGAPASRQIQDLAQAQQIHLWVNFSQFSLFVIFVPFWQRRLTPIVDAEKKEER
jgi:hypothetical protein